MSRLATDDQARSAAKPPQIPSAASGLSWVSMSRHVEKARTTIAGARFRDKLIVVSPDEYEALIDIASDASHHTEDDRMQAAIARWKDHHAID